MDDLVQFLLHRLDEDEQMARAAADGGDGQWTQPDPEHEPGRIEAERLDPVTYDEGHPNEAEAAHIARHDPARVLREVDAKRRVVELHGIVHREIGWLENGDEESAEIPVCGLCVPKHSHYPRREDVPEGPCLTVRLLALPYADHPGYREDWRP